MDNALCGGGDPNSGIGSTAVPISSGAVSMIKAAVFMGDPRWQYGLAYQVGTCRAGGVSPLFPTRVSTKELTRNVVCRPSLQLCLSERQQGPVVLRLPRSLLLYREQPGCAPGVRGCVWTAGPHLHQQQAWLGKWRRRRRRRGQRGREQRGWRQRRWRELRGEMGSVWRAGVDGAYVLPVWEHLQVERDLVLPVPVGLSETHLCQPIFVSREYSRLVIDILLIECYNAYSSSKLLV